MVPPLSFFDNEGDGGRETVPLLDFAAEFLFSSDGQGIVFGATVVFGFAPLGADPTLLLEAVESGIERTLLDLEDLFRHYLDALRDGPAVHGLLGDHAHDEEVEGSLDEVGGLHECSLLDYRQQYRRPIVDNQGEEPLLRPESQSRGEDVRLLPKDYSVRSTGRPSKTR